MMNLQRIDFRHQITVRTDVPIPEPVGPYAGPGDVVSGALRWWGLRAYTLADVGADAVRLRRSSDNAEQTFATIAGGGLDDSAITTFAAASNLFVTTLFDQSGSAVDLTQTTAGNQPALVLSGGVYIMRFANPQYMSASAITQAQPITVSWIAKRTASFTSYGIVFQAMIGPNVNNGFRNAADSVSLYTGATEVNAAATDNAFHACQFVLNGASSDINVDGTSNTVNPGNSAGFSSSEIYYSGANQGNPFTGDSMELGIWGVAFSGSQSTQLSSQQHSFWGF